MTTAEKTELALVPICGSGLWLMAPQLPEKIGVGTLALWMSAVVLFQSLMRDLWLLARAKRAAQPGARRPAQCMCVESTIGVTGVVVALAVLGAGFDRPVAIGHWVWSFLLMATMAVGFAVKDYVVEWNPFRVRRDKDHVNIVFAWKR